MNAGESALRLTDYLGHMLEAASLARGYVSGITQSEFLRDRRTQQAVVLNLITLGEAAARVSNEHKDFAESHPETHSQDGPRQTLTLQLAERSSREAGDCRQIKLLGGAQGPGWQYSCGCRRARGFVIRWSGGLGRLSTPVLGCGTCRRVRDTSNGLAWLWRFETRQLIGSSRDRKVRPRLGSRHVRGRSTLHR